MQHTLKEQVIFKGKGLHSGKQITMIVSPAMPNQGIKFVRVDVENLDNVILAKWDNVEASQLCTLLKNDDDVSVKTIEHVMSAFAGMGIDNAIITLDGSEVPIMDGSAIQFIEAFESVGVESQAGDRNAIRILKTIEVKDDQGRIARFEPDVSSVFEFTIDFDDAMIGRQKHIFELSNSQNFIDEIAHCRTFTRMQDVEMLMQAGLIKGGGLENAVVYDGDKILNPEGLRCKNEAVRHKILDAIGDVYLAGSPIIGRFVCEKGGHALTNKLLRKLFLDKTAFSDIVDHFGIGTKLSENVSASVKLAYNA